jgi:hypothetical protein
LFRAASGITQTLFVRAVRDRTAHLAVANDPQRQRLVADERGLVHFRGGKPREPGLFHLGDRVGLIGLRRAPGSLREVQRPVGDSAQFRTPT